MSISSFRWAGRVVRHSVELAVLEIQPLGFLAIEWAGAAAIEDRQLIAAFVDGAVAIDAF
jgi:hypothetical protein